MVKIIGAVKQREQFIAETERGIAGVKQRLGKAKMINDGRYKLPRKIDKVQGDNTDMDRINAAVEGRRSVRDRLTVNKKIVEQQNGKEQKESHYER